MSATVADDPVSQSTDPEVTRLAILARFLHA